ncbi:MAG TPA: zf-HC2 domain-containing protein [Gemmatimonadales bacterium]
MRSTVPPIDCHAALDRLYEYLDDELTPEIEAAVRDHLARCTRCFGRFDFERSYLVFLETRARTRGAPADLKRRILAELFTPNGR